MSLFHPRLPVYRPKAAIRPFTPRQAAVCFLVAQGLRNKQIAKAIGTTDDYVRQILVRIFPKIGVCSRLQLANWWAVHNQHIGTDTQVGNPPSEAERPGSGCAGAACGN